MPAGKLRHQIDVLRETAVRDPAGQPINTFTPLHESLPCAYYEASGGEGPRGLKVDATVQAVIDLRYLGDIKQTDRVRYGERDLSIVRVLDLDGRGRWLQLHCSEVR